jgi:hypothetical protein
MLASGEAPNHPPHALLCVVLSTMGHRGSFGISLPSTGEPLNNGQAKSRPQRHWRSLAFGNPFPAKWTKTETGQPRQKRPVFARSEEFPVNKRGETVRTKTCGSPEWIRTLVHDLEMRTARLIEVRSLAVPKNFVRS